MCVIKELMLEQGIEPPSLGRSPGKTVQNVTALRIWQLESFPHHVANQVVGNELSACHHRLCSFAECASLSNMVPEQIPR
jgi:hypothetical protein